MQRPSALPLLLLALVLPAGAQPKPEPPAPPAGDRDDVKVTVELPGGAMEIAAMDLVRAGAQAVGGVLAIDPQVEAVRLKIAMGTASNPVTLTWGAIKAILDFHDIVIVESKPTPDSQFLIRVHHRRNINQKEGPPWRVVDGDKLPPYDEIVTAVFQVKHGAGNSIFATVRGLLTRDTNRIGNILYVQGSELIMIVDIASKVRYYADVIARLDVEGPPDGTTNVFQLQFADAGGVASELRKLFGRPEPQESSQPVVTQAPPPAGPALRIVADTRTNQVLVTGEPSIVAQARSVVTALDVKVNAGEVVLRVYAVEADDTRAVLVFMDRSLRALANSRGMAPAEVFEGPKPKTIAVVARASDLPRVEEALKLASGR